ncbi:MAG: hypothetical protein FJ279_30980, partial [Planctomycetes bacterium]|nr:hypothetical protein [Planctomycetota bacterium]
MKTFILAAVSVFLFSRGLAMAQTDTTPTMRHVNYVAVRAQRGSQVKVQVANMQHGFAPYADLLKCRLVRPDGFIAASALVPVGGKADIAAKVEWDGRCALETNSGWNLAKVQLPADLPHAYVSKLNQPLKTVRAWGPLYFVVPKGTPYFNIFVHASVKKEGLHLTIKNPSGEVVREEDGDFDEVTKIQIVLPKGQGDGVWSVELSPPKTPGMALDDVYVELGPQLPPFLAPKPEWAKLFAADWKPEAVKPSAPAEKTPPKLEPFRGATGPEIDRAYSRDTSAGWKTSLPFTYILDYGGKHLGNPDYIPAVSTAPPTLLHLGKDVPFNHGWGPVKALGGENQAYGHGESIQRLTPDEVRERITGLKAMVDGLHKAGARWVTPYICAMTVNGDNERRTGFWEFYDHWDDYRPLGLCAKPAADPFQWLQRTPEGKPRIYYGYNYPAEFYPPFKTNHRLAACWRTEGWRTWLCEVVRFAARCGHDGVFVDNAGSQRCQCPRCLAAFREFLKKRFTVERARELFGDTPLDSIAFPDKPGTPLAAELNRFWCETLRDEMATL